MSKQMQTTAVLGTGIMGSAIAKNLKKNGFEVRVWNRTIERAASLEAYGIKACPKAGEAVKGADIILTVLKDGPAVLETMKEAAVGFSKGAIWAQLGTVGLMAIDELAAFAAEHDIRLFDLAMQGTRQPAEQGKLTILASGPVEGKALLQPVLDAIGQKTIWISERVGDSSRLKLALNSWVFALTNGVAESLALAVKLGLDPQLVVDVITGGPLDNGYFQTKAASILKNDYEVSFSIINAVKDAQLVLDASQATGLMADLAEGGLKRFTRALERGHGEKDMAASFLAG